MMRLICNNELHRNKTNNVAFVNIIDSYQSDQSALCAHWVAKNLSFLLMTTKTNGGRTGAVVRVSILDQGVPGSSPGLCSVCCGLEQVTFTPCLVLVKPRKRWTDDRLGQTVMRLETTLCLMCSVQGT